MQDAYVKNRLSGKGKRKSMELAGYSRFTPAKRVDGVKADGLPTACQERILAELDARGLDESYMADQYQKGIAASMDPDLAPKVDAAGQAKLLLQLGYLRGHGLRREKDTPQVAVQINNAPAPAAGIEGKEGEILAALESIRAALEQNKPEGA